jgi:hypothetical protein
MATTFLREGAAAAHPQIPRAIAPLSAQASASPAGQGLEAGSAGWFAGLASLASGLGLVATGISLFNAPPAMPHRIVDTVDTDFLIPREDLIPFGRGGGGAGHNVVSKFAHSETGEVAYVKTIASDLLLNELVDGFVIRHVYEKVFGRKAPAPRIVIDKETGLARAANLFSEFLNSLGVIKKPVGTCATLSLWSPSLGSDNENVASFLSRIEAGAKIDPSIRVPGLGGILAVRNAVSGDSNAGNMIFVYDLDGSIRAVSIDHERTGDIKFFKLHLGPLECAKEALYRGFITEAKDPDYEKQDLSALEIFSVIAREQMIVELMGDDDIESYRRFSDSEVCLLAELVKGDIEDGKVLESYQALANLERSDVEALVVGDVAQVFDPKVVSAKIDSVMHRVEKTREFLASLPKQQPPKEDTQSPSLSLSI